MNIFDDISGNEDFVMLLGFFIFFLLMFLLPFAFLYPILDYERRIGMEITIYIWTLGVIILVVAICSKHNYIIMTRMEQIQDVAKKLLKLSRGGKENENPFR